ncbi:aminotransferase class I/II-fold pyridoxal phosphate-dependent enzyme [Candidatus Pelagibacter sp.]|nr:aminotransferase class I/II-fold pyridoxal phosphate-dependent enzyme [Candidatus Pelagibacter sp.]
MTINIKDFTITLPTNLDRILKKIDKNLKGLVFVVDEKNKLLGSISDGDIRRGFIKKKVGEVVSITSKFINLKPFFLNYKTETKNILYHLQSKKNKNKFKCIPLVDANKIIKDISTIENLRRYPIANLNLSNQELGNAFDAIKSGWISSKGAYVDEFEKSFSKYIGGGYSVTTSSGTTALELALKTFEIGKGDEVILPNFSFAASINSIINVGATPVVVDVEQDTWTIDVEKITKKITKKTKAIMPVHIYGQPCKLDEIIKIAKSKKIYVIEDAAEALGATYKGKKIGLNGDCSCFSFYANKIITTGEGGMVVFKNKKNSEYASLIKNHGMSLKTTYYHTAVGANFRMTNPQAAIGLAQLNRISELYKLRKKAFDYYDKNLKKNNFIKFLPKNKWSKNSLWLYTITLGNLKKKKRDILIKKLLAKGIETRPGFVSFNQMKIYKKYCKGTYPVSSKISNSSLSLPTTNLSHEDQNYIISQLLFEIDKLNKSLNYNNE